MDRMVQIQRVAVNCCHAKEAMRKVVEYMNCEPVNVAEMVTMQTLVRIMEQEEVPALNEFDFIFAGSKEVLNSAGVTDLRLLSEAEDLLFLKMFLKYLHKNKKSVFLLTQDAKLTEEVLDYARENYPGIHVAGTANMEENNISDDAIINIINGTESECVIALVDSPQQEQFISQNRSILNSRLWMGLGVEVRTRLAGHPLKNRILNFVAGLFVKKKMKQVRKETQEM